MPTQKETDAGCRHGLPTWDADAGCRRGVPTLKETDELTREMCLALNAMADALSRHHAP
ncbi:MAG: hypothetical protein IKR25_01780 [Muribaculaceae bacterium]|nr:hypothetical protein [Muribaculaceae bacterium]